MKTLLYKIAAMLCGGALYRFEGRDSRGRWSGGLCIMSKGAMDGQRNVFRAGACNISETNMEALDWPYFHTSSSLNRSTP